MSSEDILSLRPPPADVRLAYGAEACQFGDLRLPAGTGPHPVVVAIHGGYWRARYDLEHLGHLCAALTAAGAATWNIEYRRIGNRGGGWPGTLQDVGRAVDWVRELAATYPLDMARVAVVGHSAGGQLALWVAGRQRLPRTSVVASDAPLPVRGVVALAGVCDLRQAWERHLSGGAVQALLGGTPATAPERYAAASPAELLPLGVRQMLLHGTADADVPLALSRDYGASARSAGDDAELLELPGAGHFELIDPRAHEWPEVVAAVVAVLGDLNRTA